ncbi:MAG: hypothetical protein HQK83_10110 [Fibrobacteria bacterium]|nr:hypothetical protein [Fibrobacteria bacterium]
MKIKDIIGIALVSIAFFPVVLIVIALAMGVARIEFGMDRETKQKAETFLRQYQPLQDDAEIKHMKTYEALQKKQTEIAEQKVGLNRQIERLENLKRENLAIKEQIAKDRNKIENLVSQSSDIQNRRIKALAEVYGSMRPEEAAPILLTLNDKLVAKIIRLVPEVRSQSKLLGALGVMDVARAASISKIMGVPFKMKEKQIN